MLQARGDSGDAAAALSELCAAYYAPVHTFMRHYGYSGEAARDLTQEFFARLLAKGSIGSVEPERGRFRCYLLGAVKHFLFDMRDRELRLKRGGGQTIEPLDSGTDTSDGLQVPDRATLTPERQFDRKWALTLLYRALTRLAQEHELARTTEQFEVLKPWLIGDTENSSQSDAAGRLKMSESAVKVAIHRLRRRFREMIKAEIRQTIGNSAELDQELRYLLQALL